MASVLLSTNSKSSYFYFGLITGISLAAIYFLTFKKPSSVNNFHRQAFELNYSAFANGIRLANYQHLASDQQASNKPIQKMIKNNLIFNNKGYPISKKIIHEKRQMPNSALDCKYIWDSVLGPLRPELSISKPAKGYWVKLSTEDICVIQTTDLSDLTIQYHANMGKVTIVRVTD
ncbi:hypothetical protein [Aliikangiella sp. IMCC44359]|uniref:hypothetical protein n=1 Tax=Aliikangiella sp. IMCC44359 TaxID=3459125 RepID=UPI00403B0278